MATDPTLTDPLYLLRRAIASNQLPVLTTSEDSDTSTDDLSQATHLQFPHQASLFLPLTTPTRFISETVPVDLRSVFFAFQKKDVPIPDYIASAQQLNSALEQNNAGTKVLNLKFVERLDLITWLEGGVDESEYITPLEGVGKGDAITEPSAQAAAPTAPAAVTAAGTRPSAKQIEPRLQEIYNGERRMGDRNSILHGIKPTEFSHVRKIAESSFLHRTRATATRPGQKSSVPHGSSHKPGSTTTAPLPSHLKPGKSVSSAAPSNSSGSGSSSSSSSSSHRRPDPIILISPSASSLLRLSNIKSFLQDGVYVPPDHPHLSAASTPLSILHISRSIPSVDTSQPTRFIVVDSPDQFKPEYWNRVVAVFTTGQTWQFKSYRWRDPAELFRNVLGVYVGWSGEHVPDTVRGWGRGVVCKEVDKWVESRDGFGARGDPVGTAGKSRWRDREVVEGIWAAVEERMKRRGWGKEGPRS